MIFDFSIFDFRLGFAKASLGAPENGHDQAA